jgi:hypothetical protein
VREPAPRRPTRWSIRQLRAGGGSPCQSGSL